MAAPIQKHTETDKSVRCMGQAAQLSSQGRAAELTRAVHSLEEALIGGDRAEILAKFGRVVVLFAQEQHWHKGLRVARRVYKVVVRWDDFDSAPYALTVAQFAHNYAIDLQQSRVMEAAQDFYTEALSIFQTYGDSSHALVTAHQLGRLQQDQGEYWQAEQFYKTSLEIAREQSDYLHIAKNLFQLGQLAQLTGQRQRSASLYHEVLALADSISSAPLWTAAAHQLGILEQASGDYVQAQNWFERALERARQSGDERGAADALHQLGMVAQAQGALARAEKLYKTSLSTADQSMDSVPTLYQLAQTARARDDLLSAESFARQSLHLSQAQGNLANIQRAQNLLQRLAQERAVSASAP